MREQFSEMTPIFKNTFVTKDDISSLMETFAKDRKLLRNPARMLIGSYYGKEIMLTTPLVQWYLKHGLVITKIYEVVQYQPSHCFKDFGNAVTEARREGDIDSDKKLIGETSKLIGNSFYGKTITNKNKNI